MSKIELYPRQVIFKNAILDEMKKGSKHIIGSACPAFGKSYIIASISADSIKKGTTVLLLTHRLKILSQNNGALKAFSVDPIIINDEKKHNLPNGLMYSSSAQTFKSRFMDDDIQDLLKRKKLIVLLDEIHRQEYNFLLESGIVDDVWVLGFTGTANRFGQQRQLGLDFDVIVETMKKSEVIKNGELPMCKYYEVPVDISNVAKNTETGDYQAKSAYKTFDKNVVYNGILKNYKLYGEGKQFVCFCSNISHAIKTCLELNKGGLRTKFVVSSVGKPNEPENKDGGEYVRYLDNLETYNLLQENQHLASTPDTINNELEAGEIDGLCTIEILSTGWSYDPLTVLIMARCTTSPALWRQIGGRVERNHKDKPYGIVIDFGDNVRRMGQFDEDLEPQLWHEFSDSVGVPNLKECPKEKKDKRKRNGCGRLILSSYSICPKCGFVFKTEQEEREIILKERLQEEPDSFKEMSPKALCDYAELKKFKKNWVFRQLHIRSETPKQFRDDMRSLGYSNAFIFRLQNQYK